MWLFPIRRLSEITFGFVKWCHLQPYEDCNPYEGFFLKIGFKVLVCFIWSAVESSFQLQHQSGFSLSLNGE